MESKTADIYRHPREMDRLSDADMSSSPSPLLLASFLLSSHSFLSPETPSSFTDVVVHTCLNVKIVFLFVWRFLISMLSASARRYLGVNVDSLLIAIV